VTTNTYSTNPQRGLAPRQEVLPALRPMTERQIIDQAVTAPQARGIFGLIEGMRRDHRAIVAERNLLDALRERQASHILARYEAQLQLDLGQIVEAVRHELSMIQITNQKMEMDWAAELTLEASKARVQVWVKFGEFMKSLNVMPAEQVERMVAQFIAMEVSATTTHLATMGGIDGVRRSTQAG
jgi:hypothetical protein